ncbi:MAG: YwmB family TATA-box binding protein [Lachnospiraceae bacterium]|nr:YwmB family TATA-box binding protein [Lachnospiraceae bacterium]
MNKKTKIYVLVLIWCAVLIQLFIHSSVDREERLVRQVLSTDVDAVTDSTIKGFGVYGTEVLTENAKELIVKRVAGKLGITSGYTISNEVVSDKTVTRLTKLGEQGNTEVKLVCAMAKDAYGQDVLENYLMVQIELTAQASGAAVSVKEDVMALYESLGIVPDMNLHMKSQYKGKLTDTEMEEETEAFLRELDATKVSEDRFEGVKTVYGYSKNIDDYVYQDTNMVNAQIAFSYDEENDVTYIHRALPFIDGPF